MLPDLSPEQRARLARVTECADRADKTVHKRCRERWDELYKLYRVYQDAKSWAAANPGVDTAREVQAEWGSDLHIPYSFANVETIVPRMLSNAPKGLLLPRDETAIATGENMRMTLDAQQEQVNYMLTCQTTAKTGQIFGLGWQKDSWRTVKRNRQQLRAASPVNDFEWTVEQSDRVLHDDPWVEDVSPYDVLWDPYADSVHACEWIIHRTWRQHRYVMARINSGAWDLAVGTDGEPLTDEDIRGLGSATLHSEIWQVRRDVQGYTTSADQGYQVHEILEFHDGDRVITVLDRQLPVRDIPNPSWHGDMPFHAYRPSEVPHEMVGIGAIEPARYLQYEMDLMRSQRRDYNSLALSPTFFYEDGRIDPAHLLIRPGGAIPVLGDPKDVLNRVQLGEPGQSSYAEEDRIRADIERAIGLSDSVMGASAQQAGTATEAQLQLAAANVRIQNMTKRFEVEAIASVMNHWVELNQQHIVARRGYAREVPTPGEPDRRFTWFEVGPEELMGQMLWRSLGGATAPENIPQDRADAAAGHQMFAGDPNVDQRMLARWALEKGGVSRHPDGFLTPENFVPPETLNFAVQGLQEAGMDPKVSQQILAQALQAAREPQAQNGAVGAQQ